MRGLRPPVLLLALSLVGAALVLLAAVATTLAPGAGLPPDGGAPVLLGERKEAEWTLVTEGLGLSGLRVWLAQPAPAGAALAVSVSRADLPEVALAEAIVPLVAGASGAVDIRIPPQRAGASPAVLTATLLVRLSAHGGEGGPRLALQGGYAAGGEGRALAFAPLYQVRPFDALWPISRMADGRPGLLGWPPLYALLAYSALVMLPYGLWAALRQAGAARPYPD